METKSAYLVQGPITGEMIAGAVTYYAQYPHIGAHDLFTGQIRGDLIDGKTVVSIEYSAYAPMAENQFEDIGMEAMARFDLADVVIKHSIGTVAVGEISLMVIVAGAHRKETMQGLRWTVEAIKERVPVFGKEIFADGDHSWKVNR